MKNYELIIEHQSTLIEWIENISALFNANSLSHEPLQDEQWPLESSSTPNTGSVKTHINFNTQKDCQQMSSFLDSQKLTYEKRIETIAPWQEYHQQFMKEIQVGHLTIDPSSCPREPQKNRLYFPAGLGFGTGHHETTRGCLTLMQRINLKDKHLLDFGSGSGILSVAGGILGVKSLSFLDIDNQAIEATTANIAAHGFSKIAQVCTAQSIPSHVDCIVANILCSPLVENRKLLADHLPQGSPLITSGILEEQSIYFENKMSEYFIKDSCLKDKQWCTYLWEKK